MLSRLPELSVHARPIFCGMRCKLNNIFALVCLDIRQTTQDAPEEVRNRSFRRELEERERELLQETKIETVPLESIQPLQCPRSLGETRSRPPTSMRMTLQQTCVFHFLQSSSLFFFLPFLFYLSCFLKYFDSFGFKK
ncbi:hypothetical protein MC885_014353 [Smutsia gigantea]|nr:hypothetical protein MC885_014353 [Smutsia gigantea]